MKAAKGGRGWERSVCPSMPKAPATASSPAHPSSHPSITGWGRRNGQQCLKQTEQKSEQRREESGEQNPLEVGEEVDETQVRWWEIQGVRARERLSSITLPLFFIPVTFFMAPWLLDLGVCCHFSALPCHSALAPARPPPAGGRSVVSRAWTSHCCCTTVQVLWRTKADSGAADLRSRGDRRKPVHTWVLHPRTNASSIQQPNSIMRHYPRRIKMQPTASVKYKGKWFLKFKQWWWRAQKRHPTKWSSHRTVFHSDIFIWIP